MGNRSKKRSLDRENNMDKGTELWQHLTGSETYGAMVKSAESEVS